MIKRDLETENFINSLPDEEREVYKFMRAEYDKVTDEGDKYDVEKHDEIVANSASQKFNISIEQAGNIYVLVESKISDFHEERKQ